MEGSSGIAGASGLVPPRPVRGFRGVAIVVVAAVLLSAGGALFYVLRPSGQPVATLPPGSPPDVGNTTPREIRKLSEGQAILDVPLMTFYSAPALNVRGFGTSAELSMSSSSAGPSSSFTFVWDQVTGTNLPVRFSFDPGPPHPYFAKGPPDGFVYLPAGECIADCLRTGWGDATQRVGAKLAYFVIWRMDYSVHEMQAMRNHVNESWLQVNFSFSPRVEGTEGLPAPNVTSPSSGDLTPVGGPISLHYGRGLPWQYNVSIHQFAGPDRAFLHSVPPVDLDAGPIGHLTAVLTASFSWGPAEDDLLGLSGSDGVNVTLQFYLDARFGALLVRYLD